MIVMLMIDNRDANVHVDDRDVYVDTDDRDVLMSMSIQ